MQEPETTSRAAQEPPTRRHDLDALRAFAMLLGLVLHAGLAYTSYPWIVQDSDESNAGLFNMSVGVIHGFRMPLFFMVSGFFTAMLWRRRGLGSLMRHRLKRIALPLVLSCVTIIPLMWGAYWYATDRPSTEELAMLTAQTDLWTAAAEGNVDAVRAHIERGADINAQDPGFGTTPLGFTAVMGRPGAARVLLDAGADPSGRYADQNTPLHSAMFLGRAEVAELLLDAGADLEAVNMQGETPVDSMAHGEGVTNFIVGMLRLELGFAQVEEGRAGIRELLDLEAQPRGWRDVMTELVDAVVFHHLWFLYYLLWLIAGFVVLAATVGRAGTPKALKTLVSFPVCLVYLIPITVWVQSMMSTELGADTSVGWLPSPKILLYYAVFYFFGSLLYAGAGIGARVGKWWVAALTLAVFAFFGAVGLGVHGHLWAGTVDDGARRVLALVSGALYAWLLTFTLMGICEQALAKERRWVRYVSDASYWMYLVHLPVVIVLQVWARDWGAPSLVKFAFVLVGVTAFSLVTYALFVRYTPIGTLLNGKRVRAGRGSGGAPPPRSV